MVIKSPKDEYCTPRNDFEIVLKGKGKAKGNDELLMLGQKKLCRVKTLMLPIILIFESFLCRREAHDMLCLGRLNTKPWPWADGSHPVITNAHTMQNK